VPTANCPFYVIVARDRIGLCQVRHIKRWFKKYRETITEYKIKQRNIVNFDEAGFWVGCLKSTYILVPLDVIEFYTLSLEN
jgi:hypothetical protein